jgi:predicted RNA polymerase sigma factor
MHLTDARRATRLDVNGLPTNLTRQDRTRCNSDEINPGLSLLSRARNLDDPGPYQIQGAIAAVHARANDAARTDWAMIAALYDGLNALARSPVIAMNRAVAIGLSRGPLEGLELLDESGLRESLTRHHRYHVARGHLLELSDEFDAAQQAWERTGTPHERPRTTGAHRAPLDDVTRELGPDDSRQLL